MFGKNYDEQINKLVESDNYLHDLFSSMQATMIDYAKVQAQHKIIISFLLNHATVDADAQEDLEKMMKDIANLKLELEKNK